MLVEENSTPPPRASDPHPSDSRKLPRLPHWSVQSCQATLPRMGEQPLCAWAARIPREPVSRKTAHDFPGIRRGAIPPRPKPEKRPTAKREAPPVPYGEQLKRVSATDGRLFHDAGLPTEGSIYKPEARATGAHLWIATSLTHVRGRDLLCAPWQQNVPGDSTTEQPNSAPTGSQALASSLLLEAQPPGRYEVASNPSKRSATWEQ